MWPLGHYYVAEVMHDAHRLQGGDKGKEGVRQPCRRHSGARGGTAIGDKGWGCTGPMPTPACPGRDASGIVAFPVTRGTKRNKVSTAGFVMMRGTQQNKKDRKSVV